MMARSTCYKEMFDDSPSLRAFPPFCCDFSSLPCHATCEMLLIRGAVLEAHMMWKLGSTHPTPSEWVPDDRLFFPLPYLVDKVGEGGVLGLDRREEAQRHAAIQLGVIPHRPHGLMTRHRLELRTWGHKTIYTYIRLVFELGIQEIKYIYIRLHVNIV